MVLDTSVLVAALQSQLGASRVLLNAALVSRFELLISNPLVLEYEAVLSRPGHLQASGLTATELAELLDDICTAETPVSIARTLRPQLPDPDDEMVLEAAVNGTPPPSSLSTARTLLV